MKRSFFALMMLCAGMLTQAQTIHVNHHFWDGYCLYTVKEIRMGKYFYMTTSQGNELTLEKVDGKQGEYKLIPSRQAEECPFGAQFGWRVQHITQEGQNFLAIRKPNGDVMWVLDHTTKDEEKCEYLQQMMGQEEPWNAVNSILLNRAYLRSNFATKEELRLLRNKVLAYHGYYFQSKDLQEYFSKIAWYMPVDDNDAIKLNIIEQTNIQLIKSEEAEREENQTGDLLGDEPYWETEEGVAECIHEYFDAVNKTFTEGSGMNPYDLDKKYYSAYWNEVYDKVNKKESNATSAEQLFFVDDNHWTAGMETPVEAKNIKVEFLADEKAEAILTLVDKKHGHTQKVILTLDFEEAIWRISNWLEKSHDTSGSILVRMKSYLDEPLEEVQELTSANMAGIYDDEKQESRFCLHEDGTATWGMIGSLHYTEYTYNINGHTICLKPKGVESEDDCYDYDEDTRTLKNEQGTVYYRQVVD